MIELEEDGNGKFVIPGPDTHGRVYRVINQYTGRVGYNCTTSNKPGLDPKTVQMIEGYETFGGWVTEILSSDETVDEVSRLNALTPRYESTTFTDLKERITERAKTDPDLAELVKLLRRADTDLSKAWR